MKRLRYYTQIVSLPLGSPVTTTEISVQLDKDYERCTGIAVYRQSASNTLSLGIRLDGGNTFQELTHPADWESTTSVGHDARYKPVTIPAAGKSHKLLVQPLAILAAAETIHVVWRLESE